MSTEPEIVWEDPGPTRVPQTYRSKWRRIVEELEQHPGRWARVVINRHNLVMNQKRALMILGCETTTRSAGAGNSVLYARWPEEQTS